MIEKIIIAVVVLAMFCWAVFFLTVDTPDDDELDRELEEAKRKNYE